MSVAITGGNPEAYRDTFKLDIIYVNVSQ
ncbi:hypothetical protein D9758_011022 [Tetrapyrgos nigripes]|uniref:Uncharacterized protein n=1 Tax=Tetrapyrgos nigripes TaxID=182062 RepID=A0A8H5LPZ1_9AGAR|nr:hypothetical protein D9758_011022 [Tetrapyrgos nigripes]